MDEEKLLDRIIEILDLITAFTPPTGANPALPIIREKINRLKLIRTLSKNRFKLHFDNISKITKQISDITL